MDLLNIIWGYIILTTIAINHSPGHGREEEGVCNLAAACFFNALGSYNSTFCQTLPRSIANAPILWTITHDAKNTEEIMEFIESSLYGVKFVCHMHAKGTFLSPEDGEMARLASTLCIHPVSAAMEESSSKEGGQNDYYGSLLGLDLDMLAMSIGSRIRDQDVEPSWRNFLPPVDLLSRLRSLEERYNFFSGQSKFLMNILDTFKSTGIASVGEAKDVMKNGADRSPERDYKAEYAARAQLDRFISPEHRAQQENENVVKEDTYDKMDVKIVDLGNACYTHKHFTGNFI